MNYIKEAFNEICAEAKEARGHYVVLMLKSPYYGGPEEGGWWGEDHLIVSYQCFPTLDEAMDVKNAVIKLAKKLNAEERERYGKQCIVELDWCDARGIDYDFLPEPDGESEYYVEVSEGIPTESYGSRHYE